MARPANPPTRNDLSTDGRSTDDRSLGDLFAELSRETSDLVREEVSLAKTELTAKATAIGKDIGFLAAGGAILYAGFLALIAALIVGISQAGLTWWLSALIVGIVVVAIGAFLAWMGINNLKRTSAVPQQTLQSIKEDVQWTKNQI